MAIRKRKNHPPTWFEKQREKFLNMLDDLIFLQNIHALVGYKGCMRIVSIVIVTVFLYLTVTAFSAN